MTKEKTERNKQIFLLRNQGYTTAQIATKFGLTIPRIRQICLAYERSHCLHHTKRSNQKLYNALENANNKYHITDSIWVIKTYRILHDSGIARELLIKNKKLSDYSDEFLLRLPRFGPKCLDLIRVAEEFYN